MKSKLRNVLKRISHSKLEPLFSVTYKIVVRLEYLYLRVKWFIAGKKKPTKEEVEFVKQNVTFMFKSFERQKMAKRLFKNIQSYYPGVKVVIADDSKKPLTIKNDNLEIINLPFNSGLSYGLNQALSKIKTPYVVRMDDDQLLTPYSKVGEQLKFLMEHQEVDLVGMVLLSTPKLLAPQKAAVEYYRQPMSYAPKPLIIPHLTGVDKTHVILGKTSNTFLARTDKLKELGWDDNIRMIDHDEFFRRAAGNIVSALDITTMIFHYPNRFDANYGKYRSDVENDRIYISRKYSNY